MLHNLKLIGSVNILLFDSLLNDLFITKIKETHKKN